MLRKKNPGFTLAEITVAMVIIGIMAVLAIPSYQWVVLRVKNEEARQALLNVYRAQLVYKKETGNYADAFVDLDFDFPPGAYSSFNAIQVDILSVARCAGGQANRIGHIVRIDGLYILELLEDGTTQCKAVGGCTASICKHLN